LGSRFSGKVGAYILAIWEGREERDIPVRDLLWPGRSFLGVTTGTPIWVVSTL